MYEENDNLFYDALDKDLRKPKWESMAAEVENNKNDIIGALRYSYFSNILYQKGVPIQLPHFIKHSSQPSLPAHIF